MSDGNRLSRLFTSCLLNYSISAIAPKEQRDDLSSVISLQVRPAWLDIQEIEKRFDVTYQAIAQADENLKVTMTATSRACLPIPTCLRRKIYASRLTTTLAMRVMTPPWPHGTCGVR